MCCAVIAHLRADFSRSLKLTGSKLRDRICSPPDTRHFMARGRRLTGASLLVAQTLQFGSERKALFAELFNIARFPASWIQRANRYNPTMRNTTPEGTHMIAPPSC